MYKRILFVVAIILLFSVGCGKKENPKPVDKPSSEAPVEKPSETRKLKVVDETSKVRPYAIMINNINVARPVQAGLQDAYLVYEIIVEGGITRFLALFKDVNTPKIGTIRSARHYYLDYALENDAIYVHHGQSPQAASDIKNLGVTVLPGNWIFRENPLKLAVEHTAYSSIAKLDKARNNVKRKELNKDLLLNYSVEEHTYEGEDATDVTLKYSSHVTVNYKYDKENKVYLRSTNGKPHKDLESKKQYTVKNIIAYSVDNYTMGANNKGRQDLKNIGKGKGIYISNGVKIPITWEKKSRSDQTVYKTEDGKKLIVNDGNTFIQIYPSSGKLTIK
jgi:hypothetical protein